MEMAKLRDHLRLLTEKLKPASRRTSRRRLKKRHRHIIGRKKSGDSPLFCHVFGISGNATAVTFTAAAAFATVFMTVMWP